MRDRQGLRNPEGGISMHLSPFLLQTGGLLLSGLLLLTCDRGSDNHRDGWGEPELMVEGDPVIRGAEEGEIPALRDPQMVPASEAESFMLENEPVVGVVPPGEKPRAYSTWHLDSHELVNDQLRSGPLLVTW